MRRLKFSCPFGGKQYPVYAAFISVAVVPLLTMGFPGFSLTLLFWLTMLSPVAVLAGCFYYEHRLTAGEKCIIEETTYPLWLPAPPEIIDAVRDVKSTPSHAVITIGLVALGSVFAMIFPDTGEPNLPAAGGIILAYIGIYLTDRYLRGEWKNVDQSLVYTEIPIHHMYDIKHSNKHNTWYESYLVFYLPDGRYTLHAKKGTGAVGSIFVMKYRGMVIWIPSFPLPEPLDESRINTLVP